MEYNHLHAFVSIKVLKVVHGWTSNVIAIIEWPGIWNGRPSPLQ